MTVLDYAALYETEVRPRQRRRRLAWTLGFLLGASLTGVAISLLSLL